MNDHELAFLMRGAAPRGACTQELDDARALLTIADQLQRVALAMARRAIDEGLTVRIVRESLQPKENDGDIR